MRRDITLRVVGVAGGEGFAVASVRSVTVPHSRVALAVAIISIPGKAPEYMGHIVGEHVSENPLHPPAVLP